MEEDRKEGPSPATTVAPAARARPGDGDDCAEAAGTTTPKPAGVARGEKEPPLATRGAPETGSGSPPPPPPPLQDPRSRGSSTGSSAPAAPVGRDAPNIPNVVEYHLKVTPQQPNRRKPAAPDTATATAVSFVTCLFTREVGRFSSLSLGCSSFRLFSPARRVNFLRCRFTVLFSLLSFLFFFFCLLFLLD